jgi:DNA-binding CsgD family transcriptional regulator
MVLIARADELAQLNSALDDCVSGKAGIVLVSGAVGCGKSELADTLAERAAARGALVLRAIGTEAERDLPLGVLGQLTLGAPAGALPGHDPADGAAAERVEAMQGFCAAVHRLSATAPVVVCVDDMHRADELSGRYLLHLARHARPARILLVLTESVHERSDDPHFTTELLRQPNFVRIRLERLGRDAVAELAQGGGADPERLYALSGGNPLLLRALAEDPGPEAGGAYSQAVLTCLHRCGRATTELAEGLAVLGRGTAEAAAQAAAQLLGITAASAAQGIAALGAAGLLDGGGFRHPAARRAVLDRLDPAGRLAMHRRAAELAHRAGAPAPEVAGQLLAARDTAQDWALPVLRAAAEQLLADGAAERAAACLELAHEAAPDEDQRAALRLRLSAIARRTAPGAAERHLAEPLAAARADRLPPPRMGPLARLLMAHGRIDEAGEVLDRLSAVSGAPAATPSGALDEAVCTLDPLDGLSAFPGWSARGPARQPRPAGHPGAIRHPAAFWALPDSADSGSAAAAADRFLRGASLSDGTLEPILQAVRVLLHLGGPQRAVPWCETYADEAVRRTAPGWQAAFSGLHAEALLRQGDLTGAEATAAAALDAAAMPERGASVLLTGIAGTLIRARTAMGRPESAAAELSRPVPEQLAASVHGLGYLRARGQYHLATSRFHAALGDFLDIGRLMKRWHLDRPLLLPWRTDAAEALLRLGEAHQAERFIADQLTARDAADPWVCGITLRLRAELRDPKERPALLAKAVDQLRGSGDRFELARALADFALALKECGEPARANMVNRRAWHLAQECGAEALRERILPGHTGEAAAVRAESTPPALSAAAELAARLSESERRVAMLALHGHTNREIAHKLYITVSTVEQHLTRVYRKLNITRRQDLPMDLQLPAGEFV